MTEQGTSKEDTQLVENCMWFMLVLNRTFHAAQMEGILSFWCCPQTNVCVRATIAPNPQPSQ